MKLYDENTEKQYSLFELYNDWLVFRSEDAWNHSACFAAELYEILMATVNGRNDCSVIGLTPAEVSRYIIRIRSGLEV